MFDTVYKLLEKMGYPHPIHPTEVHMPIGAARGGIDIWHSSYGIPTTRSGSDGTLLHYPRRPLSIPYDPVRVYGLAALLRRSLARSIRIKLVLAVVLLVLVFVSVFLVQTKRNGSAGVLTNYAASFLIVVVLGYYGGNLVYGGAKPKAPEAFVAGMDIFNENCVSCHPKGANVIVPTLPLLNSAYTSEPRNVSCVHSRSQAAERLCGGNAPSFSSTTVSDQQASELYNYITHVLAH